MSEATPTPSLLLDDECNLINKNKKESVLKVFENVPSGKRTLHTPGLAISCSLVLILSLMLAAIVTSNPVTSNPNVDIAVRVVWFFFTFIFLLYPLRLFVSNILCLVFKSNRDAMLGRPINTKTYRNVKTGSKASPDDTVTFMIPVFTESFDVIRETIFSAIAEAIRTEAKVNVLVCDDSLMFYAENNPLRPTYNSEIGRAHV